MKLTKLPIFDLPMNGHRIKDLVGLRDNFTVEILAHCKSGLLARWLKGRGLLDLCAKIDALSPGTCDDASLLKGLCQVFEIDVDDFVIAAMVEPATPFSGQPISGQAKQVLCDMLWQTFLCVTVGLHTGGAWRFMHNDLLLDRLKKGNDILATSIALLPANSKPLMLRHNIKPNGSFATEEPIAWVKMSDQPEGHYDGVFEFSQRAFKRWLGVLAEVYHAHYFGRVVAEIARDYAEPLNGQMDEETTAQYRDVLLTAQDISLGQPAE